MTNILGKNNLRQKIISAAIRSAIEKWAIEYYKHYKKYIIRRTQALNKRGNYYVVVGALGDSNFRAKVILDPLKKRTLPKAKVVDIQIG